PGVLRRGCTLVLRQPGGGAVPAAFRERGGSLAEVEEDTGPGRPTGDTKTGRGERGTSGGATRPEEAQGQGPPVTTTGLQGAAPRDVKACPVENAARRRPCKPAAAA